MKRSRFIIVRTRYFFVVSLAIAAILFGTLHVSGQTETPEAMKARAMGLMREQKMTEALPLFEKLSTLLPNDSEVQMYLGFSLMGQAANTTDPAAKKQLRVRARQAFVKCRELGDKSLTVSGLIDGLPPDGGDTKGFSDNAEANKLMEKGEAAFSTGKLDDALAAYQAALNLDPRCYFAALFSGDVFKQQNKYADAETWYQKAISIDPLIETAYRYSATPLMDQGKTDQARDRYIEAFITEPYNRMAISGIVQWANVTKTQVGHPKVDVPEITFGADGKASSTVNINPLSEDGSMAWMSYVTTREIWRKELFAKRFPKETVYRHSLQEEAEALRSVIKAATELKPKTMNEQIAKLADMDKNGVLEAFILMAIPDRGIAQDHRAYLIANRAKLRQYVMKYVIAS